MPDVKEVFEMVTQKAGPDQGALQRQHERQDRRHRRQRIGAVVLAAAVIAALAVFFLANPAGDSHGGPAGEGITPSTSVAPVTNEAPLSPAFIGLDGTVIQGVNLPGDAWEPALSADGKWIAYISRSTDVGVCGACTDGPRIVAVRVDGTGSHYVTVHGTPGTALVEQPSWSPDGSQIAFVGSDGGHRPTDIFVIDADGSNLRRLTNGPTQKGWPSWVPDGTAILYSDEGSTPLDDSGFSSTQELYRVATNGASPPERVTKNDVDDSEGVYAPDGSRIAAFHDGAIAIMDPDGSHIRAIPGAEGFAPRWSPDGTQLAFLVYNPAGRFDIVAPTQDGTYSWPRLDVKILTVKTGEITDLGASVAGFYNPASWMPDGSAVLVNRATGA